MEVAMDQQQSIDFEGNEQPFIYYDENASTLSVDDVDIHYDFQLGDDDLEVSLLIESLEQQYDEMMAGTPEHAMSLQSTKEWVSDQREKVPGLFRYLNKLIA